ncbi:hypothetical protein HDU82_003791 [Entophlyctis luteolus]|nr:hypothetical protein HDU82_003791 [Entophlyctis luteolus]
MKVMRMGGFTTGFTVQTSGLIFVFGGFVVRKVVNDIAVPAHERDNGKTILIRQETGIKVATSNLVTTLHHTTPLNFTRLYSTHYTLPKPTSYNLAAIHAERVKIQPKDIQLAHRLHGERS